MYINVTITSKGSTLSSGGNTQLILQKAALQSLRQCRGWGVNSMKGQNLSGGLFSAESGMKKTVQKKALELGQNLKKLYREESFSRGSVGLPTEARVKYTAKNSLQDTAKRFFQKQMKNLKTSH